MNFEEFFLLSLICVLFSTIVIYIQVYLLKYSSPELVAYEKSLLKKL